MSAVRAAASMQVTRIVAKDASWLRFPLLQAKEKAEAQAAAAKERAQAAAAAASLAASAAHRSPNRWDEFDDQPSADERSNPNHPSSSGKVNEDLMRDDGDTVTASGVLVNHSDTSSGMLVTKAETPVSVQGSITPTSGAREDSPINIQSGVTPTPPDSESSSSSDVLLKSTAAVRLTSPPGAPAPNAPTAKATSETEFERDAVKIDSTEATGASRDVTALDSAPSRRSPPPPPPIPTSDLDVAFPLPLIRKYMGDLEARCSFVVRVKATDAPKRAPVASRVQKFMDDDEKTDNGPVDISGTAPASRFSSACAILWFNRESAEKEVDHESSAASLSASKNAGVTLQDCLAAFTKQETLSEDDPWYCSNCKTHRQATKKFDLWKLPSILVVHLKRFNYSRWSRDKLTTFVDFPFELDLTDQLAPAMRTEGGDIYDLFAVSNHFGGMGGGHYNAYAFNHTDCRWYSHDDSSVSRVRDLGEIKSSAAYLLFYQRRKRSAKALTDESAIGAARAGGSSSRSSFSGGSAVVSSSVSDLD